VIYFEYTQSLVDAGHVPSTLCAVELSKPKSEMFRFLALADRVYEVIGLDAAEMKNRNGDPSSFRLTSEDALALKLRAVLLYN
jgi:hypothetical protein